MNAEGMPDGQAMAASAEDDACVRLDEELMIYQVPQVWSQLEAAIRALTGRGGDQILRVDAASLRELDGAGLQLLLLAGRHLAALGAGLRLIGLDARIAARLQPMDRAGLLGLPEAEVA